MNCFANPVLSVSAVSSQSNSHGSVVGSPRAGVLSVQCLRGKEVMSAVSRREGWRCCVYRLNIF